MPPRCLFIDSSKLSNTMRCSSSMRSADFSVLGFLTGTGTFGAGRRSSWQASSTQMADHGVTTVLQTLPYFERSDERQRPKCCRRVQLECSCSKSRTLGRHVRQARESLTSDTWDQARLGRHGQNNIGIASPNFWQGRALWRWSKSVRPAEATTKLGGEFPLKSSCP